MADFGAKFMGGMRYIGHYTVAVTAGLNSKGAWAQLSAGLPQNIDLLVIDPYGADSQSNMLWDIGIGDSGSEYSIVENIFAMQYSSGSDKTFVLPLHIDGGVRIAVRAQGTTSGSRTMKLTAYSAELSGIKGYTKFTTLGADTANSRGTAIPSGTPGAWTELSASTPITFSGGVMTIATESPSASAAAYTIELGIGTAGSEQIISKGVFTQRSWGVTDPYVHVPVSIPVGTRLVARQATASGANATVTFIGY